MSAVDTKFYEKKKTTVFYTCVFLLVLVIILTGGLYFYNKSIENSIVETNVQISSIDTSISEIESDEKVQIYSNYITYEPLLESLAYKSQIPLFISHLKKKFAIYAIDAESFNYIDGIVSIGMSVQTNDAGYAYEKVVKFLREYEQEDKSLFSVESVESFTGYDRITFNAELKLK